MSNSTKLKIPILLKTKHHIVINKPPFLYSQPPAQRSQYTNTVFHHLRKQNPSLFGDTHSDRSALFHLFPIHRLDYNVSGCMCIARTAQTAKKFSKNLKVGGNTGYPIIRKYVCLIQSLSDTNGTNEHESKAKDAGGSHSNPDSMIHVRKLSTADNLYEVTAPIEGKQAATTIRIFDLQDITRSNGTASLLEANSVHDYVPKFAIVKLQTGRKHQIRRHLQYLGYVILGDVTYGFQPTIPSSKGNTPARKPSDKPTKFFSDLYHNTPIALHSAFINAQIGLLSYSNTAPISWNPLRLWDPLIKSEIMDEKGLLCDDVVRELEAF